jgi:hypothetical protein
MILSNRCRALQKAREIFKLNGNGGKLEEVDGGKTRVGEIRCWTKQILTQPHPLWLVHLHAFLAHFYRQGHLLQNLACATRISLGSRSKAFFNLGIYLDFTTLRLLHWQISLFLPSLRHKLHFRVPYKSLLIRSLFLQSYLWFESYSSVS